jgi:hypothetical protein
MYQRFANSNSIYETDDNVSKKKINEIRALYLSKEYELFIFKLESDICNIETSIIDKYELVTKLFMCYKEIGDFRNCIVLFVKTHLENCHLTKKMPIDELVQNIIKSKYKGVGDISSLIELPIMLKICSSDKINVKQTYELYLNSNKLTRPSELISLGSSIDSNKFIFFLRDVCVPEILLLSTHFDSTYEVNEERIQILKYLAEIDEINSSNYKSEIAELTQKNTIIKVIGGIDERKIFVNEQKIRENIRKSEKQSILQNEQISPLTNESFDRYKKLLEYVKNNNEYRDVSSVIHFGENGQITYIEPMNTEEIDKVLYLPAYRLFLTYFLNIRDLFIFSKEFGLDAYLSTRIRHGTLPNHLRSVFETYFLVTAQTDNVYSENQYWSEKLNVTPQILENIQSALGSFSLNIDAFSREIKDSYIQCKNEKKNQNEGALFDYTYSEEELIFLFLEDFNDMKLIDDFIDKSFAELWKKTEHNLEIIRNKFNGSIKDKYISIIEDLQRELTQIVDRQHISELLNNIMTCKTEIQTKLSNISKWFSRSESSYEGEYELITLVDTSIQIIKNLNPSYHFEVEKNICQNFNVSGEYHQHIIDIMHNCFTNIVKHSHLLGEEVHAKLTINEIGDKLTLDFENCVSDSSLHIPKLAEIKKNWRVSDANISLEGGTGFPKIKKIIHSDLNRKYSDFEYVINGNCLNIILTFETKGLKV